MKIVTPLKMSLFGIVELLARHNGRKEFIPTHQRYCICGCPKEEVRNRERDPYLKKQMANFPGNFAAPGTLGSIRPKR